ncbi:MAG: helicase [Bacteroidota bacterium]|jgi:ATP-dependent DNA helicase RecG
MAVFNFWKQEITYLKKVGPKRAELLKSEAGIVTFGDLLTYFPRKYVDRSQVLRIRDIRSEMSQVTLLGRITDMEEVKTRKGSRLNATFADKSGEIELVWFKSVKFIQETLKIGEEIIVFGNPRIFGKDIQIAHPEIEKGKSPEDLANSLRIIPLYASTEKLKNAGLDSKGFRGIVSSMMEMGKDEIFENLSPAITQKYKLLPRKQALIQIHSPDDFMTLRNAQDRLKFEEFFFFQLIMAHRKLVEMPLRPSHPFPVVGKYFHEFYERHIPFELTNAQKRVLREIRSDLRMPIQMNRLVQGDVGSGKTMVAFMSILLALDNGYQAALMAPTEILAEQHFSKIMGYCQPLGLKVAMLTGSVKGSARMQLLVELREGQIDILVGTHALIEDHVKFKRLGLVIVDEQHKFGVMQRARLWGKADLSPHNMVMTATPIPRTLALTLFGDIDVSQIDELPPGRKPVLTAVRTEAQRLQVFGFMQKEIEAGRQVYVVYPLVEENEKLDFIAVTEGYEAMKRRFPELQIGIVHGRMKPEAKDLEMQRFKRGETKILVATTVIEVGVDVPNASVMIVENSNRFGLSQLHQLRGRVGRGADQSYCILMTGEKTSEDAKKRLRAMVDTHDGFKIAEIDLKLRGHGDFLGTRQSGSIPELRLANFFDDGAIFEIGREAAFDLIRDDSSLSKQENQGIRNYLEQYQKKYGFLKDIV